MTKDEHVSSRRYVLKEEQALEIYMYKISMIKSKMCSHGVDSSVISLRGLSIPLAKKYNISTKAVRDIWNRKSWTHVTSRLWEHDFDKKFAKQSQNHSSNTPSFQTQYLSNNFADQERLLPPIHVCLQTLRCEDSFKVDNFNDFRYLPILPPLAPILEPLNI